MKQIRAIHGRNH